MNEYELISIGNNDPLKGRKTNLETEFFYFRILVQRCNKLCYNVFRVGDYVKDVNFLVSNGVNVEKSLELFFDTFYGVAPYDNKKDLRIRNISTESIMIDYLYYRKYALSELKTNLALLNAKINEGKEEFVALSVTQNNLKTFILNREQ